jgi:hypothetical protein
VYGFTHTLDQVSLAPALVKHVLCDEADINPSFVAMEQTQVGWAQRRGAVPAGETVLAFLFESTSWQGCIAGGRKDWAILKVEPSLAPVGGSVQGPTRTLRCTGHG